MVYSGINNIDSSVARHTGWHWLLPTVTSDTDLSAAFDCVTTHCTLVANEANKNLSNKFVGARRQFVYRCCKRAVRMLHKIGSAAMSTDFRQRLRGLTYTYTQQINVWIAILAVIVVTDRLLDVVYVGAEKNLA